MEPLLLGLDLGTTSCKAAVVTHDGREVAHGRARVRWERVATGAEIDPELLVEAALASAREALAAAPDEPVGAIGVASLAETGVLLDASGAPVAPSIAWHDSRGGAQAERMAAELGAGAGRRAHRPAAAAAVLAGEVPLAARGARAGGARRALDERRRVDRPPPRRRAGRRAVARVAHRLARPPRPRLVAGGRGSGRAPRPACCATRRPRRRRPAPRATCCRAVAARCWPSAATTI